MNRMMGANGATADEVVSTDIPLSDADIDIEDVAPKKKEVPFFTKKGKFIIGIIIVGSALYYIWQKHKASKEQTAQPQAQPEAKPTETEKAVAAESAVSNESGVEGVDL
jgi:cytoskeletal protein RodZ